MTQPRSASNADVQIGQRVRARRLELGISQEQLADAVGVSFQQVQKYEKGANRIAASRLFDVATVLDVDISFFFEDLRVSARAAKAKRRNAGKTS